MPKSKFSFFSVDSDYENFYEIARMKITWRLNLILLIFLPVLIVTLYQTGQDAATPTVIGFVLCLILFFVMKSKREYKLSAIAHCSLGAFLCIYVLVFIPESYHFVDVVWMLIIILHTYFTLGRKWGAAILIFSLVGSLYYLLFVLQTNLDMIETVDTPQVVALSINFSICMFIIAYFVRQFLSVNEHAENKYVELTRELEDKNEEKTVLLKEIHHRVKNNLQVITSLLRLQSKEITDEKYLNMYEESINRVVAMSMIHDKIFKSPDLAKIDIEEYIQTLVKDLIQSYSLTTKINLEITSEVSEVAAESLVPIALIFNELISNSLKHAYQDKEEGTIAVAFEKNGSEIKMTYSDDGEWNERVRPNSLGLDLIDSLTNQLNGKLERDSSSKGTHYSFIFQEELD